MWGSLPCSAPINASHQPSLTGTLPTQGAPTPVAEDAGDAGGADYAATPREGMASILHPPASKSCAAALPWQGLLGFL